MLARTDPFDGLPPGHFGAILADPPWYFRTRTTVVSDRDPQQHYCVMGAPDICAMPAGELAARDAHLFLWATGPCLPQALAVIEAWGFRYSGVAFTWIKLKRSHNPNQLRVLPLDRSDLHHDLHTGLGFTTRKNAEFCLLARRGNARRIAKDVREIILSPVREHSRKPDETRIRIERYCAGPYLELFSRESRAGWTCWGNEVGKFDEVLA